MVGGVGNNDPLGLPNQLFNDLTGLTQKSGEQARRPVAPDRPDAPPPAPATVEEPVTALPQEGRLMTMTQEAALATAMALEEGQKNDQLIRDVLQKLGQARTPMNEAIIGALAGYGQSLSASTISNVKRSLLTGGVKEPQQVEAAVVLMLNGIAVNPKRVQAVESLIHGAPLPESLHDLASQLDKVQSFLTQVRQEAAQAAANQARLAQDHATAELIDRQLTEAVITETILGRQEVGAEGVAAAQRAEETEAKIVDAQVQAQDADVEAALVEAAAEKADSPELQPTPGQPQPVVYERGAEPATEVSTPVEEAAVETDAPAEHLEAPVATDEPPVDADGNAASVARVADDQSVVAETAPKPMAEQVPASRHPDDDTVVTDFEPIHEPQTPVVRADTGSAPSMPQDDGAVAEMENVSRPGGEPIADAVPIPGSGQPSAMAPAPGMSERVPPTSVGPSPLPTHQTVPFTETPVVEPPETMVSALPPDVPQAPGIGTSSVPPQGLPQNPGASLVSADSPIADAAPTATAVPGAPIESAVPTANAASPARVPDGSAVAVPEVSISGEGQPIAGDPVAVDQTIAQIPVETAPEMTPLAASPAPESTVMDNPLASPPAAEHTVAPHLPVSPPVVGPAVASHSLVSSPTMEPAVAADVPVSPPTLEPEATVDPLASQPLTEPTATAHPQTSMTKAGPGVNSDPLVSSPLVEQAVEVNPLFSPTMAGQPVTGEQPSVQPGIPSSTGLASTSPIQGALPPEFAPHQVSSDGALPSSSALPPSGMPSMGDAALAAVDAPLHTPPPVQSPAVPAPPHGLEPVATAASPDSGVALSPASPPPTTPEPAIANVPAAAPSAVSEPVVANAPAVAPSAVSEPAVANDLAAAPLTTPEPAIANGPTAAPLTTSEPAVANGPAATAPTTPIFQPSSVVDDGAIPTPPATATPEDPGAQAATFLGDEALSIIAQMMAKPGPTVSPASQPPIPNPRGHSAPVGQTAPSPDIHGATPHGVGTGIGSTGSEASPVHGRAPDQPPAVPETLQSGDPVDGGTTAHDVDGGAIQPATSPAGPPVGAPISDAQGMGPAVASGITSPVTPGLGDDPSTAALAPEGYVPPVERSAKDMMSIADLFAMRTPQAKPVNAEAETADDILKAALPNLAEIVGRAAQGQQEAFGTFPAVEDDVDPTWDRDSLTEAGTRSVSTSGMAGPIRSARTLGDGSMPELGGGMAGSPEPDWALAKAPADDDDGASSQQQQQNSGQDGDREATGAPVAQAGPPVMSAGATVVADAGPATDIGPAQPMETHEASVPTSTEGEPPPPAQMQTVPHLPVVSGEAVPVEAQPLQRQQTLSSVPQPQTGPSQNPANDALNTVPLDHPSGLAPTPSAADVPDQPVFPISEAAAHAPSVTAMPVTDSPNQSVATAPIANVPSQSVSNPQAQPTMDMPASGASEQASKTVPVADAPNADVPERANAATPIVDVPDQATSVEPVAGVRNQPHAVDPAIRAPKQPDAAETAAKPLDQPDVTAPAAQSPDLPDTAGLVTETPDRPDVTVLATQASDRPDTSVPVAPAPDHPDIPMSEADASGQPGATRLRAGTPVPSDTAEPVVSTPDQSSQAGPVASPPNQLGAVMPPAGLPPQTVAPMPAVDVSHQLVAEALAAGEASPSVMGEAPVSTTPTAYVTQYGAEQVVSFKPMAGGRPRVVRNQDRPLTVQAMQMIADIEQAQQQWTASPPKAGASLFDEMGPLPPRKTSWKERIIQRAEAQARAAAGLAPLPDDPVVQTAPQTEDRPAVEVLGVDEPRAWDAPMAGPVRISRTVTIAPPAQAIGRRWSGHVHVLPKPPAPSSVGKARPAAAAPASMPDDGGTAAPAGLGTDIEASEALPTEAGLSVEPVVEAGTAPALSDAPVDPGAPRLPVEHAGSPAAESTTTLPTAPVTVDGEVAQSPTIADGDATQAPSAQPSAVSASTTDGTQPPSAVPPVVAGVPDGKMSVQVPPPAGTAAVRSDLDDEEVSQSSPPVGQSSQPIDEPDDPDGLVQADMPAAPQEPTKPKARSSFLGSALTQALRSGPTSAGNEPEADAVAEAATAGFALRMPDVAMPDPAVPIPPPTPETTTPQPASPPPAATDANDPMAKLKSKLGGGSGLGSMMGSSSLMGGFVAGSSPKPAGGGSYFNMVEAPSLAKSGEVPQAVTGTEPEATPTVGQPEVAAEAAEAGDLAPIETDMASPAVSTTGVNPIISTRAAGVDPAMAAKPTVSSEGGESADGVVEPAEAEASQASEERGEPDAGAETLEEAEPEDAGASEAPVAGRLAGRAAPASTSRSMQSMVGVQGDDASAEGMNPAVEEGEGQLEPGVGLVTGVSEALAETGELVDETTILPEEVLDEAIVAEGMETEEESAVAGAYRQPSLLGQKARMEAAVARIPITWSAAEQEIQPQPQARGEQRPGGQSGGRVPPAMAEGMELPPGVPMMGPAMDVPGVIPDLHAPIRSLLSAQADEMVAAEAMMRMAELAEAEELGHGMELVDTDPGNLTTTGTVVAGEVGATLAARNRPMPGQKYQQAQVAAILSGTALPARFVASRADSGVQVPRVPPPVAPMMRQMPAGATPPARTVKAGETAATPATTARSPERPRTPVTREMLLSMPPTLRPALAAVRLANTGAHGVWEQSRLTDDRPLEERPLTEPWARHPQTPRSVPSLMSYVQLGAGRAPVMPEEAANGRIIMPQPGPQPQKPLADRVTELAGLVKAAAESAVVTSGEEIPVQVSRMRNLMGKVESDLETLDDDLGKVMPKLARRPNPEEEDDGFWDWLFGSDEEMTDDERLVKREKAWEKAAEMRENLQSLTQSVKENRSQLFARETLAQANQALCVPLTLPGTPPIQAELLVHPDGEEKNKGGSGRHPTRIQLAVQTHGLGSVGISLEALGERLSVGLQVTTPEVKAFFDRLTAELREQLGHTGYQVDPIGVQVAAHEIMTSLLLPAKRTRWGTGAIEGIR